MASGFFDAPDFYVAASHKNSATPLRGITRPSVSVSKRQAAALRVVRERSLVMSTNEYILSIVPSPHADKGVEMNRPRVVTMRARQGFDHGRWGLLGRGQVGREENGLRNIGTINKAPNETN